MDTLQIYFIVMLDNIRAGALVCAVLFGVLAIFSTISWCEMRPRIEHPHRIFYKVGCFAGLIMFFMGFSILVFVPNTRQMSAILIIPKIVNNAKVQDMPNRVLDLAEEWIEELKPKSVEKGDK